MGTGQLNAESYPNWKTEIANICIYICIYIPHLPYMSISLLIQENGASNKNS